MIIKLLFIYIITFNICAYASDRNFDFKEFDESLQSQFYQYSEELRDLVIRSNQDKLTYFVPYERELILEQTQGILSEIVKLEKFDVDSSYNLTHKKKSKTDYERLLAKSIKYKYLSMLYNFNLFGRNAFMTVLSEGSDKIDFNSKKYFKLLRQTISQSYIKKVRNTSKSQNSRRAKKLKFLRYPTMANLAQSKRELKQLESLNNPLSDSEMSLLFLAVNTFEANIEQVKSQVEKVRLKAGRYSPLYYLKTMLLKAASYIALPGKHKISTNTLEEIDQQLRPGDIGVIQRYNKLSNIVFVGNWTHSLLYLGKYSKMISFFASDVTTQETFKILCDKEKLNCHNMETYLNEKYPNEVNSYRQGEFLDDPIVTIESLKPGVILHTMKKSMGWDNLAIIRPKLSKKDKALAIRDAFANIGKPYDYNFNAQTDDRLVCTELISLSYAPNPKIGKKGLTWEMSYVYQRPVMYAYDILETYFKREGTKEQQLDIALYIKGEKGEYDQARQATVEELRKTVNLED